MSRKSYLSKFIVGAIFLFDVMFFQVLDGIRIVHSPVQNMLVNIKLVSR